MATTPDEIEILAAELAKNVDDEATCRNVVQRYYYAAWHHVQAWVHDNDITIPAYSGGMHAGFIKALIDGNSTHKRIGYILKSMHDIRVVADYHIYQDFSNSEIEKNRTHLSRLKSLL